METTNHVPCVININTDVPQAKIFSFENYWIEHPHFRHPFPSSLLLPTSSPPSMNLPIGVPRIPNPTPFSCRSPTRRHASCSCRHTLAAESGGGPGTPVPRARHSHVAVLGYEDPRACVRTEPLATRPSLVLASPPLTAGHPPTLPRRTVMSRPWIARCSFPANG
jgi:hypothetical protein